MVDIMNKIYIKHIFCKRKKHLLSENKIQCIFQRIVKIVIA